MSKRPTDVPVYDPDVHTDPEQFVSVELYSTSGHALRQVDPVAYIERSVREFVERERAAGHEATSRAEALTEAERRREAAHIVEGRGDDYVPSTKLDALTAADESVTEWPALPGEEG